MITSPTTQCLPYQTQHVQEDWTPDKPWIYTGLVQSPQSQSSTARHSPPGLPMSTDDTERREKREKRRIQNREAQRAFRLRRRKRMQGEMEEEKDLRTKTEPQEGKDIDAGSFHTNGPRQNKRPYEWDSEHEVDVKEPRLTRSMTEKRRQRSDFEEARQPQVTSVSDAVAPHLLYCGPSPFPSGPTPGRFLSTPEYGADEHTSPSAQSELHALNRPLSPPLSQNGLGATQYCDFLDQPFEGLKFMSPSNNMPPLLSDAEFGAVPYAESYQFSLLPVESAVDDPYLPIVPNASACGVQDLTGFLPLGEEPHLVSYGCHPDELIPAQILEQRDPGVTYFFTKMTKANQLEMKKEDTKLAVKAKEVELAEKNLEIKRLETRQLELYYGKGP